MSRKVCKRKHYQTQGFNAVAHAIAGAGLVDKKSLDKLLLRDLSSLEAVIHGHGGLQEWWDLTASLNLCETMARNGIGPEALVDCELAQKELIQCAKQYEHSKTMGFTKKGIAAIRNMLEYHDLQRQSISRSEYEKFIQTTMNRIRSHAPEVEVIC
jgi:hypothetical protein